MISFVDMIWKAKYTQQSQNDGDTRLKRNFAWLPRQIDGDVVWLGYFETVQRYTVTLYTIVNEGKALAITKGEWINLTTRII